MRRLSKPPLTQASVFAACGQGVNDVGLKMRCEAIAPQLIEQELIYEQLASRGQLQQWVAHPRGNDTALTIGHVTRGDLKGLYVNQMARAGKPARIFYDQLRVSAPNNICPYCGIGAVETIDHFLPKGRYSSLSVLPSNLVPACRDCNTGKLDGVLTDARVFSHPYFEETCVFSEEWLFASILPSQVIHAVYRVVTPGTWSAETSQRVVGHFAEFDLFRRFSIQAAERLSYYANLIDGMVREGAGDDVQRILVFTIQSELAAYGVNSWQVALSKAVAHDVWFCTVGYTQLL